MAEEITDAKGRKIKLRVIDPTYSLALAEAAEDASANQGFVRIASLYMLADEIDGVPLPFPNNKAELYSVARLLGNEGVQALSDYMKGKSPSKSGDADPEKDKAKN